MPSDRRTTAPARILGPLTSGEPSDLDLYLYKVNGVLLRSSLTAGGAGSEERITQTLPVGTYVVEVSSVQGTTRFNDSRYTLTLQLE